ncbi:MAG: tyrosine-type recombinase/integrase [Anaerolineae bacterium]
MPNDMFQAFAQALEREGRRPLTVASYLSDLKGFAIWFTQTNGEAFAPQGITALDVRSFKSYLITVAGFKPATVNRRLASLSRYCGWARAQGLLPANPTDEVKGVRQVKPAPKALGTVELRRLLREVHKRAIPRDIALVELLANTGLRVGEAAQLTLADIEFSPRKGKVTVRSGKGAKYRQVPLNADARGALEDYLAVRPQTETQALFIGQRSNGLTPSAIWRVVKQYGQRAGLEISPHTLRHTFGTRLVRGKTVDLVTVAAMMGHESLDTTAIYTRPSEEDMAAAVETLGVE